jgi:hypothetical protein
MIANQTISYNFEYPKEIFSHTELASETHHLQASETDSRDQMIADRREQQRLYILRNLNCHY